MEGYLIEFVGTMFFCFVIIASNNPIADGAALAIAILSSGPKLSGQFNPAVTIMMALAGKLPMEAIVPNIISQILGGLAALELYKYFKIK